MSFRPPQGVDHEFYKSSMDEAHSMAADRILPHVPQRGHERYTGAGRNGDPAFYEELQNPHPDDLFYAYEPRKVPLVSPIEVASTRGALEVTFSFFTHPLYVAYTQRQASVYQDYIKAKRAKPQTEDMSTSEDANAEKSTSEDTNAEKTTSEDANAEKSISEDTSAEKSTSEDTSAEKSTSEDANAEKSTSEDTSAEKSTSEDTNAEKSTSEDTSAEKSTSEDANAEKSISEDTSAEKSTSEDTNAEKSTSEDTSAEKSTSEDANAEKSTSEDTNAEKTTSEDANAEKSTSEDTSAEKSTSTSKKTGSKSFISKPARKVADTLDPWFKGTFEPLNRLWKLGDLYRAGFLKFFYSATNEMVTSTTFTAVGTVFAGIHLNIDEVSPPKIIARTGDSQDDHKNAYVQGSYLKNRMDHKIVSTVHNIVALIIANCITLNFRFKTVGNVFVNPKCFISHSFTRKRYAHLARLSIFRTVVQMVTGFFIEPLVFAMVGSPTVANGAAEFAYSAITSTVIGTVTYPLTVLETFRIQECVSEAKGELRIERKSVLSQLKDIYSTLGFKALYRGYPQFLLRCVVDSMQHIFSNSMILELSATNYRALPPKALVNYERSQFAKFVQPEIMYPFSRGIPIVHVD